MIRDALDFLTKQAVEAATPKVIHLPNEPEHVYGVIGDDNVLERREALPAIRQHAAYSLESLAEFLERTPQAPNGSPGQTTFPDAHIWYSRHQVQAVLDAERRGTITMELEYTPQLEALQEMERRRDVGQKEFVRLLRIDLHDCFSGDNSLLALVRQVRAQQAVASSGSVGHEKSSLGRTIEAEMTGAAKLPETVNLRVQVFKQIPVLRQPVLCALELTPETAVFALTPLPGQMEQAIQQAEAWVGERLVDLLPGFPVTFGIA